MDMFRKYGKVSNTLLLLYIKNCEKKYIIALKRRYVFNYI